MTLLFQRIATDATAEKKLVYANRILLLKLQSLEPYKATNYYFLVDDLFHHYHRLSLLILK